MFAKMIVSVCYNNGQYSLQWWSVFASKLVDYKVDYSFLKSWNLEFSINQKNTFSIFDKFEVILELYSLFETDRLN